MQRILLLITAAVLLCGPATALAAPPVYVPPGQSAASQYTEDVPTAGGNVPAGSVHHPAPGAGSSGSGGGGGTTAGGSSGSGSSSAGASASPSGTSAASSAATSGSTISPSTLKSMSKHGSAGAEAASLAAALAPASPKRSTLSGHGTGPSSAADQVISTLGGSDASSGIGVLLPVILIVSLIAATGLGVLRLRRPGT